MKILIVGFTKLARMPYAKFFLQALAGAESEIHLLYWNRDEKPELSLPQGLTLHEFRHYQQDEVAKLTKLRSFLEYRRFARRLLRLNSFDLLVVLHTIPALLLSDVLRRKYKGKYIFDFRDLTYENNRLFRRLVGGLASDSIAVFVSSDAYRAYLPPECRVFTSHNILLDALEHRDVRRCAIRAVNPIRIRFWGLIRHERINRTILDRLANDRRFELHYHGSEQRTATNLKRHCVEQGIENVFFHGEYSPEERYRFAGATELLLNVYENDAAAVHAMTNKFYDGVALYLPQLCNVGSYMGRRATASGVGFECAPLDLSFSDDICSYYKSIEWSVFEANCDRELRDVLLEYQAGIEAIEQIVNGSIT